MPERNIAFGPEAMPRVGRHNNDVAGLRDDINAISCADASSLIDDEYLTLRMMLVRANARRIGNPWWNL